jgi:hypothetical protein
MESPSLFEERQKVAPSMMALSLAPIVLAAGIVFFTAEAGGQGAIAFWALTPVVIALGALFITVEMRTLVSDDTINIRTIYFLKRRILFAEIANASAVTYRPFRDYGGWGIRISPNGKAYNMRGDEGVQLELKNGGRVLVGSQRAGELETVVRSGIARR